MTIPKKQCMVLTQGSTVAWYIRVLLICMVFSPTAVYQSYFVHTESLQLRFAMAVGKCQRSSLHEDASWSDSNWLPYINISVSINPFFSHTDQTPSKNTSTNPTDVPLPNTKVRVTVSASILSWYERQVICLQGCSGP